MLGGRHLKILRDAHEAVGKVSFRWDRAPQNDRKGCAQARGSVSQFRRSATDTQLRRAERTIGVSAFAPFWLTPAGYVRAAVAGASSVIFSNSIRLWFWSTHGAHGWPRAECG
jgi:hypothetical protein